MKKKTLVAILIVLCLVSIFLIAFTPITAVSLTAEKLSGLGGAVVTLLFSYIPGLNTWYAAKEEANKKLFMAAVLLVIVIVLYFLICADLLAVTDMTCSTDALTQLLYMWIISVTVNQSVFKVSPQVEAVKRAKIAK